MYVLFSGADRGESTRTMLGNNTIPPPSRHLYPLCEDMSSIFAYETDTLPILLRLNHETTLLAVRLDLMANELKREEYVNLEMRQSRIITL
jgi:hypothetical protein